MPGPTHVATAPDGQLATAPTGPVASFEREVGAVRIYSPGDAEPVAPTPAPAPTAPAPEVVRPTATAQPRANQDTVTALAAEVARKLDAKVTRFELRLDPHGLGQVQISLEIRAGGEVSAHLHFERPDTAADLRARSAELRTALEQAGFSLGGAALSFDSSGGRQATPEPPARPARRPVFVEDGLDPTPPPSPSLRAARAGVDVRI
jgi:Meckel syndrome type 1 protein